MADRDTLLEEFDAARAAFHDALAEVDASLVTVPGVMGEWSVRDLVVHVAAWCEHGAGALALATEGRGAEFAYSKADTDEMNERILAASRETSPGDALRREEAAYDAFRAMVAAVGTDELATVLGNGDSVERVVRYDGPDHYAEHTDHLRAWFGPGDEDDDEG